MTGVDIPPEFAGQFPRILCGANPGGVGHVWVKRTFVEPGAYRKHRAEKLEGGMLRQYIPAKLADNPALMQSDPDYADRLQGLGDPVLVRAMLDGDWKIAAGSMFGESWRDELHTCNAFAIPSDWKIWRGGDDGFAAPAAIYWLTEDPNTKTIYVIAELYRTGMLPKTMGDSIKTIDKAIVLWDQQAARPFQNEQADLDGLLDSAAFSDNGQGNISRGKQLNAMGVKFRPAEKWAGSRVHRVQNFHRLMEKNPLDPHGRAGIVFFKCCKNAIETIPVLPRDPHNAEDVNTDGDDHAFDGVTYGLQWKQRTFGLRKVGS
jgi:hypothetical protein